VCRNAGRALLGVLPDPAAPSTAFRASAFDPDPTARVIYELHVRGFTRGETSGVSEARRGTFVGLVEKIPYLKELGVTAVELMPVFQFDEREPNYMASASSRYTASMRPIRASSVHRVSSGGWWRRSTRPDRGDPRRRL
jgi:Alpha amylase, catalytic domain